jgi:heat-inducible transcriptional repressor
MKISSNIELSSRDCLILKSVIEKYIEFNHPISSKYLHDTIFQEISPATIRNSLSMLESKGLLMHTHVSSGRVPTDLGYRYYVDELLSIEADIHEYDAKILDKLQDMADNIDNLMQATAGMLAKLSQLFGIVIISGVRKSILSEIEIVPLSSERVMVVLALESGLIRSIVLNLKVAVDTNQINAINLILRERLVGLPLREIHRTIEGRLRDTNIFEHEIVQILWQKPHTVFSLAEKDLVYTSSYGELLNYPEFQDSDILKRTINALQAPNLQNLLKHKNEHDIVHTAIGSEIEDRHLRHCSVLSTNFLGKSYNGHLAILGPKRIPYKDIKSVLKAFVEIIPNVY